MPSIQLQNKTIHQLLAVLHEQIESLIAEVIVADLSNQIYDVWDIKGIFAHVTFWHMNYAANLTALHEGKRPSLLSGPYTEINLLETSVMKKHSLKELIKKLHEAQSAIEKVVLSGKVKQMTYKLNGPIYSMHTFLDVVIGHIKHHTEDLRKANRQKPEEQRKKVLFVAGTRPNFMKIAPLLWETKNHSWIAPVVIHTGQHYDESMSTIFFRQLHIPAPQMHLDAGKIVEYEQQKQYIAKEIYEKFKNDSHVVGVVVVGDVNSTAGGAIAGQLLGKPVAHIEAGLRSFDLRMPEEHNRMLVDQIASLLFVTEPSGIANLRKEGLLDGTAKAFYVGNVMIDTLLRSLSRIRKVNKASKLKVIKGKYVVVTLHRKENLEDMVIFRSLLDMIVSVAEKSKVVWVLHPRTKKLLIEQNLFDEIRSIKTIKFVEPLGYFELISLLSDSLCAVTDSGGIQDETTVLGIPCLTIRRSTERPITTTIGSSTLVGENGAKLLRQFTRILHGKYKKSQIPKYWDGKTAPRVLRVLEAEWNS